MFAYIDNDKIVGYFSLVPKENGVMELDHLSILPEYRHKGCGTEMIKYAVSIDKSTNAKKIKIGIIEENTILKN